MVTDFPRAVPDFSLVVPNFFSVVQDFPRAITDFLSCKNQIFSSCRNSPIALMQPCSELTVEEQLSEHSILINSTGHCNLQTSLTSRVTLTWAWCWALRFALSGLLGIEVFWLCFATGSSSDTSSSESSGLDGLGKGLAQRAALSFFSDDLFTSLILASHFLTLLSKCQKPSNDWTIEQYKLLLLASHGTALSSNEKKT